MDVEKHGSSSEKYQCNKGNQNDGANFWKLKVLCYMTFGMVGVLFPLFKVSLIALSSKLLKEGLKVSLDTESFKKVDGVLFDRANLSSMTPIFLMNSLDFYETLSVCLGFVLCISLLRPIGISLSENVLNFVEVKRLQRILYDKFILEPNLSIEMHQARDLVYTRITSIEKYHSKRNYKIVNEICTILVCVTLFLILAWELGVIYFVATVIIVFVSKISWNILSNPWSEQREEKMKKTNDRLLDLLSCKDTILAHTMENPERYILQENIESDKKETSCLFVAGVVENFIMVSTFTALTPMLFIYVVLFNLSIERVFQLLIIIVVTDEALRAYLSYLAGDRMAEEYTRAKKEFADMLRMDEDELFPADFSWSGCKSLGEGTRYNNDGDNPKVRMKDKHFLSEVQHGKESKHSLLQPAISSMNESTAVNSETVHSIDLVNISLGYTNNDGNVFHIRQDVNYTFPLGSRTALMGETGAGKSTLLKTIAGLMEPLDGKVLVSGDIIDTTSSVWREQVALVNQDTVLFNRSLRENLMYGISHYVPDGVILEALDKVNLKEMILSLPQGLETLIRENGNELSGGEKQRIQIARLFLRSCPILLLDEFTSALDPKTTKDIIKEMKSFAVGKTLIMITHDVQTLELVDNVFDMKKDSVSKIIFHTEDNNHDTVA